MTRKILITSIFLGLTFVSISQSKYIINANAAYASENYCEAADKCALAYSKLTRKGKSAKKLKADMAFKTAESFRQTDRFRDANEWYERAILLEYFNEDPLVYYYNAEMLRMMNEKDKAIKNYTEYSRMVPGDPRGEVGIESCNNMGTYKTDLSTKLTVENQSKINVKQFDMAPMFGDRKDRVMYYGSSRENSTGTDKDPRTCENYMDIWVTELDKNDNWQAPYLIKGEGINTEDNEGTCAFDGRGKTMFFTRCPNLKKTNLGCDIWVSEAKSKTEWGTPKKLSLKTHDSISVGHPCVSEDGRFLIFTSDMPGGYGGRDLWYSTYEKKSDSWTTPVNMGPEINTSGNDMFATFAANGDLFYATDGKPGIGGLDIFRVAKVEGEMKWSNPKNMGAPINSYNNDYHLVEHTERRGYFTSERKSDNGENVPDIYAYIIPPYVYDLKVIVADLNDKSKIEDVKVNVTASNGDKWEGYTNKQGTVFWDKKPTGDRYINEEASYTIQISKEGYHENLDGSRFTTIGVKEDQSFVIEMPLLPIKPIRLPEVRYALAKWDLLVDSTINSKDSLNYVYDLLTEFPKMTLQLNSHTDSRGSATSNQNLSQNRAHACYVYLVQEKGIDPRRIVPVGKGESTPREVYRNGDEYAVIMPRDAEGNPLEGWAPVILTESLINSYKTKNKELFDRLHQWNRRTDAEVLNMNFDPATAPEAPKSYMEFIKVGR